MSEFGKGIPLASGFDLGAKLPLDSRTVVETLADRDANVTGNRAYEGMKVYVKENKKNYQYINAEWKEIDVDIDLDNYVTEDELNEKGYLTEHQDISGKADKTELFSKDYNDLTNKPIIPSIEGLATETYVKNEIANAQLGGDDTEVDLSGYATKDDLSLKANISDIPINVSQLNNDSGFITEIPSEYITETELEDKKYLTQHQDISHLASKTELEEGLNTKANISDVPTKVSDLTNDSNFLTEIPSEYVTDNELNEKGYLTQHQDISHLASKTDLADGLGTKANISDVPTKISQLENDGNYLTNIPSEYVTEDELNNKGYLTEHQNISHLATKDDLTSGLNSKANISDVPTKISQLTNDSNYLTNIPSEYITETELNAKNYLTEHQDISHLASKTELENGLNAKANVSDVPTKISDLDNDSNYVTNDELNNKGYLTEHQDISHLASKEELFSKDYNDLTNKPIIPSIEGLATETYVKNEIAQAKLEGEEIDLSGYATKDDLKIKANTSDIPTKVSQLTNDNNYISTIPSEYITETELENMGYLTEHQDISHLALKTEVENQLNSKANASDVPTKVSDLTNDSNFISSIPSEYITETELEDKGYLTEHQSISHLASKEELTNGLATKANASDVPTKISQLENDGNYITEIPSEYITETELEDKKYLTQHQDISHLATKTELNTKANASDIPTKVSDLTNDKGYLTSIPSEYITETELDNMGYLTEHQDISHLASKTELEEGLGTKANISDVPTKVSDLTNDSNYLTEIPSEYITETELNAKNYLTEHQDISYLASKTELTNGLSTKANISDVPTNVSDLTNDSGYISSIPSEYITETELEDKGYLTEHQDISHLASKDELTSGLSTKANASDVPTKVSQLTNDNNYISTIPSEYITETELENKKYLTQHQDISHLALKTEVESQLSTKANASDIPTKVSDLTNDSNYLTSIPSEYITETELEGKKYLTEHQDISHLATKNELTNGLSTKANISDVPTKVSDLTNDSGYATETYVKNEIAQAKLEGEEIDLSGYATKDDLATKANISDVPTKVSDLTNDSGYLTEIPSDYITEDELDKKGYLTEHQNISHLASKEELTNGLNTKANISDIPTKVSQLTNDSNYLTSIPSEYITETELENKKYLTEHQSISHLASKEELTNGLNTKANASDVPTKVSDLTNDSGYLTEIPSEYITESELESKKYLTEHQDISHLASKTELEEGLGTKANISDVPTNVSDLTNDSGYISSIPSEYVTEIELENKKYLTQHQDISHLASKEELTNGLNTKANASDVPTKVSDLDNDSGFITEIPSEYITETELNNKGYLTQHQDISHLASKTELENGLSTKANTSDVPTKVSDLTNDSGYLTSIPSDYITEDELNAKKYLTEHQNISHLASKEELTNGLNTKANISDIPTNVSDLNNDSGFITEIPNEYITETELNNKGYLTEHQNISHLASKEELTNGLGTKANISDIPTNVSDLNNDSGYISSIPSEYITETELENMGYLTEHQNISHLASKEELTNGLNTKANISDIPTKVSQLENDNKYLTSIPSEYITETELNNKGYLTEHQDISHLATKEELNTKANISDVPTKVSDLDNDSNYLTSIPSEYITNDELDKKGYLTEHQNISHLASKTELTDGLNTKANISDIPTKVSQLENDNKYLTSIPSEYITETELNAKKYLTEHQDISHLATKNEVSEKANVSDIPTKVSDLDNDSNFISSIPSEYVTETELNNKGYLTQHQNISHLASKTELENGLSTKANISDIPTKVSDLTNDSNYLTSIPSEYITETELDNMGYLTEHQDISHLATKNELTTKANISDVPTKVSQLTNDSNYLTSIPSEYVTETELNAKKYLTEQNISHLASKTELTSGLSTKANTSDIPTKVSQLTNDNNYLTSIPSEYITETELENMGYLTEHQNISHLATKTELSTKANTSDIPTKVSQLTNDSNYLTEIPSEYVTETELNNKGYLTQHQDISHLATKTELNSKANTSDIPTKTSQLTNDSNFLTEVPSKYVTEIELSSMNYATVSQIPTSLPANGGNADTIGGFGIWFGTQEQYDAIVVKDANTIYLIQYVPSNNDDEEEITTTLSNLDISILDDSDVSGGVIYLCFVIDGQNVGNGDVVAINWTGGSSSTENYSLQTSWSDIWYADDDSVGEATSTEDGVAKGEGALIETSSTSVNGNGQATCTIVDRPDVNTYRYVRTMLTVIAQSYPINLHFETLNVTVNDTPVPILNIGNFFTGCTVNVTHD